MATKTTTTATTNTSYFNGPGGVIATNTTISNCSSKCFARARDAIATANKTPTDTIFTATNSTAATAATSAQPHVLACN
eukprot:1644747-Ditylum_brightwellii.AAC.1